MGALGGLNASSGPTDIAHDSIDSQDIAIVIESLYRDIGTSRAAFAAFFHLQEPERIQPIIGYRVLSDFWRSMLSERAARSPTTRKPASRYELALSSFRPARGRE